MNMLPWRTCSATFCQANGLSARITAAVRINTTKPYIRIR